MALTYLFRRLCAFVAVAVHPRMFVCVCVRPPLPRGIRSLSGATGFSVALTARLLAVLSTHKPAHTHVLLCALSLGP